jgi:hypothetical protein
LDEAGPVGRTPPTVFVFLGRQHNAHLARRASIFNLQNPQNEPMLPPKFLSGSAQNNFATKV